MSGAKRLLDLFCCAGGCSVGYHRAGFDVVGVDLVRQADYPFEFHIGDALTFPLDGFDVVHASPPCKHRTVLQSTNAHRLHLFDPNPDLVAAMRERLTEWGGPYVIENVPSPKGDQLRDPLILCGSTFGLRVRRHRLFESNVPLAGEPCRHKEQGQVVGVYGSGGADSGRASRGGGGGVKVAGQEAADALGIDWTTYQPALSQAIPPAYTEHIGRQLLAHLAGEPYSPEADT